MNRVRCFVAAELSAEAREDLAGLQARLRDHLRGQEAPCRWVAPQALHLTLKFLGEVEPDTFAALERALVRPLGVAGPLRLEAAGVGAFPSVRRARVVWAGLEGDVALLAQAALAVEARAEPWGIPREGRFFRPHLTLGRARDPSGIPGAEGALAQEAGYRGPPFAVEALVLFESLLGPGGPRYVPRATIPL